MKPLRPRSARCLGGLILIAACGSAGAQLTALLDTRASRSFTPLSAPLIVNTQRLGDQQAPAIAANAAGQGVVVWDSVGEDGDLNGIFGQRFDAGGQRLGLPFQVNVHTRFQQRSPQVAMDAGGGFVVVWASNAQDALTGISLRGRRFGADGSPLSPEFRIDDSGRNVSPRPALAMNAAGEFAVAWSESFSLILGGARNGYIVVRRFGADGRPLGPSQDIDSTGLNKAAFPDISLAEDGRAAASWTVEPAGGFIPGLIDLGIGIFTRRLDADGQPLATPRKVDFPSGLANVDFSAVQVQPDGGYTVVWQALDAAFQPAGLSARRYAADGRPLAGPRALGAAAEQQRRPRLAAVDGGVAVLASSAAGLHLRHCGAADCGPPVRVDTQAVGAEALLPALAAVGPTRVVAAWQAPGENPGDGRDIQLRLFELTP
jgi:hypothetical protein